MRALLRHLYCELCARGEFERVGLSRAKFQNLRRHRSGTVAGAKVVGSVADGDVIGKMDDLPVLVQPQDIQRHPGVFHPERPVVCL